MSEKQAKLGLHQEARKLLRYRIPLVLVILLNCALIARVPYLQLRSARAQTQKPAQSLNQTQVPTGTVPAPPAVDRVADAADAAVPDVTAASDSTINEEPPTPTVDPTSQTVQDPVVPADPVVSTGAHAQENIHSPDGPVADRGTPSGPSDASALPNDWATMELPPLVVVLPPSALVDQWPTDVAHGQQHPEKHAVTELPSSSPSSAIESVTVPGGPAEQVTVDPVDVLPFAADNGPSSSAGTSDRRPTISRLVTQGVHLLSALDETRAARRELDWAPVDSSVEPLRVEVPEPGQSTAQATTPDSSVTNTTISEPGAPAGSESGDRVEAQQSTADGGASEGAATRSSTTGSWTQMVFRNPVENAGEVSFLVDQQVYTLLPGEAHEFPCQHARVVKFHRGAELGVWQQRLDPGVYQFSVDAQGWQLRPVTRP